MIPRSCLFSLLMTVAASPAMADFEADLGFLRRAVQLADFSDRDFEAFRDPTKGQKDFRLSSDHAPWAGNYFAMDAGGIAFRWQDPAGTHAKDWKLIPKDRLRQMSEKEIDALSPVEKYDLLRGDYDFKATQRELSARGPLRATPPKDWEGFCNGVRCAGINLPEPKRPIQLTNPDGVVVTFQPADLKALAGASFFYVEKYAQIGAPSDAGRGETQPNPAVFDMALRYYLGENRKAFVIDSHLGSEIWNESVIGYKRTLREIPMGFIDRFRFPKTSKVIEVTLVLETLGEMDIAASNGPTTDRVAKGQLHQTLETGYTLYLDHDGHAYDGHWKNRPGDRGVDFAWFGTGEGSDGLQKAGSSNRYMDYKVIKSLFMTANRASCDRIFGN